MQPWLTNNFKLRVHDDFEKCVKAKGGLCKNQGKELYGVSGLFDKACKNHDGKKVGFSKFKKYSDSRLLLLLLLLLLLMENESIIFI